MFLFILFIARCFGLSDDHPQVNRTKEVAISTTDPLCLVQLRVSCRQLIAVVFLCITFLNILLKYENFKMVVEIIKIISII
jgi:hypothetical protein